MSESDGTAHISLIDFFRYFSHDFQFNTMVLSLRAGPLTKESKGWTNDVSEPRGLIDPRLMSAVSTRWLVIATGCASRIPLRSHTMWRALSLKTDCTPFVESLCVRHE